TRIPALTLPRSGPAARSNISTRPRRRRSLRLPTTISSRVSDSASQQPWRSSPSSSPPASPGFPAAAAPSRTPNVKREPSRRRRPHAKARFRNGNVRDPSPDDLYGLHAVKLTLEVFVATALWAIDGSIEVPFF